MNEILFSVLRVKSKTYITPHYIRIILTGGHQEIKKFENVEIGSHNKIFIPVDKAQPVRWPTFGNDDLDNIDNLVPALIPHKRTYTLRNLDVPKEEMVIDFVAHGSSGPGSKWAMEAQPGDLLGVGMKTRNKQLFNLTNQYVFVGDSTAIPVISVILERIPEDAYAQVLLEVSQKEDEQILSSPGNVDIRWLYNPHPEKESELADALEKITLPDTGSSRFAFVAAENKTVKRVRHLLLNQRDWKSEEVKIHSYWRAGDSE